MKTMRSSTAIYTMRIHPNLVSDIDGQYLGGDESLSRCSSTALFIL